MSLLAHALVFGLLTSPAAKAPPRSVTQLTRANATVLAAFAKVTARAH